jgi:hypothetical protein
VIYRIDYTSGHAGGSTAGARKDGAADIAAFVLDATRDPGRAAAHDAAYAGCRFA